MKKLGCKKCGGSTIKMKKGGASESKGLLCPDGYYWTVQGCEKKASGYKKPLSSTGSKIGIATTVGGAIGLGIKRISDAFKAKKEKKKEIQEIMNTVKKANVKKLGGAKYKSGGIAKQTIVGMPGYNANTSTMKKGGSAKTSKLASLAPPRNKVTRADVIAGALKNKRKKK